MNESSDRELLGRIDERVKTLYNNSEKQERRIARIEMFLGALTLATAAYGMKVILTMQGLPTP